jgi:hypothetical protein
VKLWVSRSCAEAAAWKHAQQLSGAKDTPDPTSTGGCSFCDCCCCSGDTARALVRLALLPLARLLELPASYIATEEAAASWARVLRTPAERHGLSVSDIDTEEAAASGAREGHGGGGGKGGGGKDGESSGGCAAQTAGEQCAWPLSVTAEHERRARDRVRGLLGNWTESIAPTQAGLKYLAGQGLAAAKADWRTKGVSGMAAMSLTYTQWGAEIARDISRALAEVESEPAGGS